MQIRANWVNLKLDFTLKINEDLSETSPVHVIHTFYSKLKILDPITLEALPQVGWSRAYQQSH